MIAGEGVGVVTFSRQSGKPRQERQALLQMSSATETRNVVDQPGARPVGDGASGPVIILGMGRSGTTWLGKIFDSHPGTLYRHEPEKAFELQDVPRIVPREDAARYRSAVRQYVEQVPRTAQTDVAGILPVMKKRGESQIRYQARRTGILALKLLARATRETNLPSVLLEPRRADLRVVWKSLRFVGRAGALAAAVPEARIVHIMRHPCGVMSSRLRGREDGGFQVLRRGSKQFERIATMLDSDCGDGLPLKESDLEKLRPEEVQSVRWALLNSKVMNEIQDAPGSLSIRYEDVCSDSIGVAKHIFACVDLPWETEVERFLNRSTSSHSSRYYSTSKDPQVAANKWRERVPQEIQESVKRLVGRTRAGSRYFDSAASIGEQAVPVQ